MVIIALKRVFADVRYLILAGVVGFAVFVFSTWLPNLGLVVKVVGSPSASFADKMVFLASLLESIQTNFTLFSASYTIAVAVLFGVNAAMVAYYFSQQKQFVKQSGLVTSFGGLISGVFGIGCAACGTLVLGPLLSFIGAGGLALLLPFGGQEFGIAGMGLLGFSVFMTSKKIQDPAVCKIKD
jgi:hypothetical protein